MAKAKSRIETVQSSLSGIARITGVSTSAAIAGITTMSLGFDITCSDVICNDDTASIDCD